MKRNFGFIKKHLRYKNQFYYFVLFGVMFQPARNIPGTFAKCFLSVAMLRASREHLGNISRENIFRKIFDGKVFFVFKSV